MINVFPNVYQALWLESLRPPPLKISKPKKNEMEHLLRTAYYKNQITVKNIELEKHSNEIQIQTLKKMCGGALTGTEKKFIRYSFALFTQMGFPGSYKATDIDDLNRLIHSTLGMPSYYKPVRDNELKTGDYTIFIRTLSLGSIVVIFKYPVQEEPEYFPHIPMVNLLNFHSNL